MLPGEVLTGFRAAPLCLCLAVSGTADRLISGPTWNTISHLSDRDWNDARAADLRQATQIGEPLKMVFEQIEKLKRDFTDKYVVVDSDRPELRRFQAMTGVVKTVNMNGRCGAIRCEPKYWLV